MCVIGDYTFHCICFKLLETTNIKSSTIMLTRQKGKKIKKIKILELAMWLKFLRKSVFVRTQDYATT